MHKFFISLFLISFSSFAEENHFKCTQSTNGNSIYWGQRTIVLHPVRNNYIEYNNLVTALNWAANQWNKPGCSDLNFEIGNEAQSNQIGFNIPQSESDEVFNENIITISETGLPNDALAITTVTFDDETGEIYDVDIELNIANFNFADCSISDCLDAHDLKNTLTHELGHALGLDHTDNNIFSVMNDSSFVGDMSKRYLTQTDIDAICYIYPKGEIAQNCYAATAESQTLKNQNKEVSLNGCSQTKPNSLICWFILAFLISYRKIKVL
jgi:hypothetical protein